LITFLAADGCKRVLDIDIDFTVLICKLCNNIFDTWARMGRLLTRPSMTPAGVIDAKLPRNQIVHVPVEGKSDTRKFLGLILGRYMHRCLRALYPACRPALEGHRSFVAMALFIPLHLTCMYLECKDGPASTENVRKVGKGKGAHNYMGCMDLLIAYYLFLCAKTADTQPGPLDFTRFSVFYIKELPDAPPPVWDSVLHPTLSDFVFDGGRPADPVELVAYASDRLMTLYAERVAPLLPLIKGQPPPANPLCLLAGAYFISATELDTQLLRNLDTQAVPNNISYFMQHIGIAAVLWHIRRYLLSETPRLSQLLDEWMRAQLLKEWTNIAENSPFAMDLPQAQLIYQMQNTLRPEHMLGSAAALGTGVELTLVRTLEREAVLELLSECGRCSVFKAAARLRRWNFMQQAPPHLLAQPSLPLALLRGCARRLAPEARGGSRRSALA
jgi:hypothetical protein